MLRLLKPQLMKKIIRITLTDGSIIDRDYQAAAQLSKLPLNLAANSSTLAQMQMAICQSGFLHYEDPRTSPTYSKFVAPSQIKHTEIIFENQMTVEA